MRHIPEIIAALDFDDLESAKRLVDRLLPEVKLYKIGMRLFSSYGPEAIKQIINMGAQVFVDLKLHDIPEIVARTVSNLLKYKISMYTLHIQGGGDMIKKAVEVSSETSGQKSFSIGVGILTSLNGNNLKQLGIYNSVRDEMLILAKMAKEAGIDGLVCSGQEIDLLRQEFGDEMIIITPGVRPEGFSRNDHRRNITPVEAANKGADYLVMGRPIIQSKDPKKLIEEVKSKLWINKKK